MADVVPLRGRTNPPDHPDRADRLAEVAAVIRGTGLAGLVRPASQPVDAPSTTNEILPVVPALRPLLPWGGLRRGSTVAVDANAGHPDPDPDRATGPGRAGQSRVSRRQPSTRGTARSDRTPLTAVPAMDVGVRSAAAGATSILLALISAASAGGSWCVVVGLPALGAVAAGEAGINLDRLALVPYPGPDWPAVVAALLDGFDLVVTAPPGRVGADVAGRLSARARQRGSVLLAVGGWAGAELVLAPTASAWEGLGQGRGRLRRRELTVVAHGRGAATRPRYAHLHLPLADLVPAAPVTSAPVTSAPVEHAAVERAPLEHAAVERAVVGGGRGSGLAAVVELPAPSGREWEALDGFELAEAVGACG